MRPCPIGVPGELVIGGAGVTRGYAKRQDLTDEKFLPDPFSNTQYKRMYRSGDLVRWMPDGNLQFLGRVDNQVKLRGFRIELGEIEAQIAKMGGVVEVAVLVRVHPRSGKDHLCAFVSTNRAVEVRDMEGAVSSALPHYMVPSTWNMMDELPHMPNGKLNRHKLPEPE
jgi:acyl-coenzyme A synthetase/AMP-(fatty) acid ligase